MSNVLVLDSEAMAALGGPKSERKAEVRAAMLAALRLNREVVVPAVILAELFRGPRFNAVVDSCLARESAIDVAVTDRPMAKMVGGILGGAGAGSQDLADAHCVAVAVQAGGGVVLTGDDADLQRLSAGYSNVVVSRI